MELRDEGEVLNGANSHISFKFSKKTSVLKNAAHIFLIIRQICARKSSKKS